MQAWLIVSIAAGLLSVGTAIGLYIWVNKQEPGTERAQQVAKWIREGATSYLKRLYTALALVAVALGILIAIVFSFDIAHLGTAGAISVSPARGITMALAFVGGAFCSAIAGYMGMRVAVAANVRTATAAYQNINKAFQVAFNAGSVMGWPW
jgi:K(+)-stimulated pyrophosphate-energized sodium pump